ncbi:hypothetical protein CDD81_4548 [Ophiocordyceps australis]|uniref:Uncharacterized protein n=1 Tax=Ophiocordyceps australis TaxID=1399860 RepID=A0A2C5YA25_9HYPO|nr:hypothetical protein CDD81_4548 [Ophiocordyceps australis]
MIGDEGDNGCSQHCQLAYRANHGPAPLRQGIWAKSLAVRLSTIKDAGMVGCERPVISSDGPVDTKNWWNMRCVSLH